MRRSKQQLPEAEAIEILRACTSGVLAVHGNMGYPYAVPLSYAYEAGTDRKLVEQAPPYGVVVEMVEQAPPCGSV